MARAQRQKKQAIDQVLFPTAIESERAILGYCINNAVCIELPEEYFYNPVYREIAKAIRAVAKDGITPDVTAVAEYIARNSRQTGVSAAEVINVTEYACLPENYDFHVENIRSAHIARRLYRQCAYVSNNPIELRNPEKLRDYASSIYECVDALLQGTSITSRKAGPVRVSDIAAKVIADLEKGKTATTHISSGLPDYDDATGGLGRGDLIVVAARPGMGKTAFALTIARSIAKKGNVVLIFSLEMSREQLAQRLIAQEGRINLKELRLGKLDTDDMVKAMKAGEAISTLPIVIDDTPALSETEIRFRSRLVRPDVIIIDYLQLCRPSIKADRRDLEIATITAAMKALAKECDCPVVLLSQLNREVEKRSDKTPMLSDLRDSGAIEQDADVIVFLYRADYYNRNKAPTGTADIIIAKQRNGPTGIKTVGFWEEYTEFYCIEKESAWT